MESIYYLLSIIFFSILFIFKYRNHQNLPPSPFALPIVGHLHLLKKPLHRTLESLSRQYGPILRLKFGFRDVLVISSPPSIEEVFTKNDILFANRPDFLTGKHLGHSHTTLAWAPYGNHWRTLRRLSSTEIFSPNRVLMSSHILSEQISFQINKMVEECPQDEWKSIDLKSALFDITVDIMMRIVAGRPCYGEEMEIEDKKKHRDFFKDTFVPNMGANMGDLFTVLRRVRFLGLEKKLVELQKTRTKFLQGLIDERRRKNAGTEKITLIDRLLSLQRTDPDFYTDESIRGLIGMMFTAGTDTSAATMEWAMSLLLNQPSVLEKERVEIDSHVKDGRLINDSDLSNLSYLHCIINETLRLFPVGPLLVPHSSSEDCTIGGYKITRGTTLFVNAWALHRDPKLWEDSNNFKPERFESVEGERDGFRFIPFGVGRRVCPGATLGTKVITFVLGTLIQCFEWKRNGPELIDLTEGSGTTMPKLKPLLAMYKPRQCTTKSQG